MTPSHKTAGFLAASFLAARGASASGGETLPFNSILDTIFSNLTGPTAHALVGIALVLGLCAVMFARDSEWARTLGKVVLCGACIAAIPTLLQLMNVQGAGGPSGWTSDLLLLGFLAALVALIAWAASAPRRAAKLPS
ncbi:MAG TPA: TrbC/VirB2 family protein [Thermoanaerobaculia bacterium]|nr:TrbC/VirB2 family protein [Thermoanaerobaculia bacterium]